jgi:cholesterol oxidase
LNSHLHVGLGLSKYRGKFTYDKAKDQLMLDWSKNGLDDTIQAAKHWNEIINEANPGSETDSVIIKNKYLNNLSYHPLGGCVIGEATDFLGRIVEYPNLYINDSTLIPGVAACSNPAYVIAALAERNIDKIIQEDFV